MSPVSVLVLAFLALSVAAWDTRIIQCYNVFGKWPCWYAQTCGYNVYECNGDAPDAPPYTASASGWVIFGFFVAALVVIAGLIGLVILFWVKGWWWCCCCKKE